MLKLKSNGIMARYLYHSTLSNHWTPRRTDLCDITAIFIGSLARDLFMLGLVCITIPIGMIYSFVGLFTPLFEGPIDRLFTGTGIAGWIVAFSIACFYVWGLLGKGVHKAGIGAWVTEARQGWKDKYCPVIDITD